MTTERHIALEHQRRLAGRTRYVHFTDEEGAKDILRTGKLLKSSYVSGVYAVAEGGAFIPGVATTSLGRATNRDIAVIFSCDEWPNIIYPEECIWHAPSIRIKNATAVDQRKGAALLNGSGVVRSPELLWETVKGIPWHPELPRRWPKSTLLSIRKLLSGGEGVAAMKAIREHTGFDLKTCIQVRAHLLLSLNL